MNKAALADGAKPTSDRAGQADHLVDMGRQIDPLVPRVRARFSMRISALAIALVQVLDVTTTNAGLASGGVELNPIMRLSMAKLGWLWWLPKAAVGLFILAYVFSGLTRTPPRHIIALTAIALTVSALYVANNIAQLAAG
jgi:hypothetical protein